jgi:S-adenosylmethionine:tRNA ribosyltransferase-isomerase
MPLSPANFTYHLPPQLIAHSPLPQRDHSRLLVFYRHSQTWSHHFFYELPQILRQTGHHYLFVRNNSRVIPARLFGHKTTGGHVEIFLTRQLHHSPTTQTWLCLTKPRLHPRQLIHLNSAPPALTATVLRSHPDGTADIDFTADTATFQHFLHQSGHTPIPPYIHSPLNESQLRRAYQTTYAKHSGSVAAPTAGLHFTADLTQQLRNAGHQFAAVTLHVSLGTFASVNADQLHRHRLHQENYTITPTNLRTITAAATHSPPTPILAVGTTSTRVLETIATTPPVSFPATTQIFLYPPYRFRSTQALITNFHLPQSSLLMLVAAFCSAPNTATHFTNWADSPIGHAYQDAIAHQYRFYSFGDAMLIL